MARLSDDAIAFALLVFTLFVMVSGIASSSTVGDLIPNPMFYLGLLLTHLILITRDRRVSIPFERAGNNRIKSLFTIGSAYSTFIVLTPIIVGVFLAGTLLTSTQMMEATFLLPDAQILGQNTVDLANSISNSPIFTLLIFIAFGMIETLLFFGSGFEFLKDRTTKLNASLIVVAGFTAFHIFVKSVISANGLNVGLISTLAFAIVSVLLVNLTRQQIEAVGLHGLTNGVAGFLKLKKLGLL